MTECRIRWADDGSEMDVTIKESCDVGSNDEEIFFYGMSREKCIEAKEAHELCEGEWYIVEVY